MRTLSGNRLALVSARPASSLMPAGSSSRKSALAGNGPSNVTRLPSSPKGALQVFPSGPFSTAAPVCPGSSAALKRRLMGNTGMQPARGFSRSQWNSAKKASRVSNVSTWSCSVATPEADVMPLPHTRLTLAFWGRRCRHCSSTTLPRSGSLLKSQRLAARIASRSAPVTICALTRCWMPAMANPARERTEASSGTLSKTRMNTWSSAMPRLPA